MIDASSPAAVRGSEEPVLVIGAGPVGQTAALLLARWGVPVIVLDARPHRDPVGSRHLSSSVTSSTSGAR
jgi:2-polyprenyl-6-methoxyphenol hydroxylase-like FAD-dependent oxidoreductase